MFTIDLSTLKGWMILYLALGALVLLVVYVHGQLRKKTFAHELAIIMEKEQSKRLPFWKKILSKFAVAFVVLPVAWLVWPAVLFIKIRSEIRERCRNIEDSRESASYSEARRRPKKWASLKVDDTEDFEVRPDERLQRHTVEQVENLHRINDPMGAVPDLPFGHLNHRWDAFMALLQPDDEIWSFRTTRLPMDDEFSAFDGYVIVRHGKSADFFLTRPTWAEPLGRKA